MHCHLRVAGAAAEPVLEAREVRASRAARRGSRTRSCLAHARQHNRQARSAEADRSRSRWRRGTPRSRSRSRQGTSAREMHRNTTKISPDILGMKSRAVRPRLSAAAAIQRVDQAADEREVEAGQHGAHGERRGPAGAAPGPADREADRGQHVIPALDASQGAGGPYLLASIPCMAAFASRAARISPLKPAATPKSRTDEHEPGLGAEVAVEPVANPPAEDGGDAHLQAHGGEAGGAHDLSPRGVGWSTAGELRESGASVQNRLPRSMPASTGVNHKLLKDSAAREMVSSMSASLWARDTNSASNCDWAGTCRARAWPGNSARSARCRRVFALGVVGDRAARKNRVQHASRPG